MQSAFWHCVVFFWSLENYYCTAEVDFKRHSSSGRTATDPVRVFANRNSAAVSVHENWVLSCCPRPVDGDWARVEYVYVGTAICSLRARKIFNHRRATKSDRNKFKISLKTLKIKIKLKIYTSVIMWFDEAVWSERTPQKPLTIGLRGWYSQYNENKISNNYSSVRNLSKSSIREITLIHLQDTSEERKVLDAYQKVNPK